MLFDQKINHRNLPSEAVERLAAIRRLAEAQQSRPLASRITETEAGWPLDGPRNAMERPFEIGQQRSPVGFGALPLVTMWLWVQRRRG